VAISGNRRCANCDYENEPGAVVCARCGASLEGVTTVAVSSVGAIDVLEPLLQPPALSIGEVMFLIAGKTDPVIIKVPPDQNRVVLGRRAAGEKLPDLDLSDYSMVAGSVSRHHAVLHLSEDRPTVEDLGSTNGTWLNENRLVAYKSYPIRTGDLLRLGQQFVFVYFSTGTITVDTVVLVDQKEPAASAPRLTLTDLTQHIGGYLHAIEGMQAVVNQVLGQLPVEVGVNDVDLHEAPTLTRVGITGASGAIRLVLATIVPWRKRHAQELGQLWQANPTAAASDDQAGTPPPVLSDDLVLLTGGILKRLAPNLADADQATYTELLLPHVRTIALHRLELSANQ
jgi:pSer/pThr/pTyr-binding forkhead associated (FHA) protein